jgi:AcrR family transcriptional regulator
MMNIVQDMNEKKPAERKPKGRPKLDDTRAKVLEAARKRIVADGLAGLSARGLAKAAGCSVGTLYNVFGDLDGVIREVNIGTMRQLEGALAAALKKAPEGAGQTARLTAMAGAYLDFAMDHTGLWNALFEFRPRDKADQRLPEMREALFDKMMRRGGHGTEPATDQDRIALRMLWGAVHGVVSLSVNRFIPEADRETARDYVNLVVSTGVEGYRALLRTGRA